MTQHWIPACAGMTDALDSRLRGNDIKKSMSLQEIKNKLDIAEVVKSYIHLTPAGKNYKARCPFHKEKTPSFIVSPDRQTWHCFGACGEGGDIFKFVMKYENLEFYEAMKVLAERAGIDLKKFSPAEQRQFGILYDINKAAQEFFVAQLKLSAEALAYLKERGLKKETIEEFGIGFAPAGFDKLTLFLIKFGYNIKDIERAGLNIKSERGGYFDRFRNRIMFPIENHFGKTIGFSSRILPQFDDGKMGKYVNSPETPIFSKSKILYGFSRSKKNIRDGKEAILVEGQMDFLMCWQAGIKNLAAVSGTALTNDHLIILRRLADKLIFSFDNDEAGWNASERAIDLAKAADFDVKILIMEKFKDPAEAVIADSVAFQKMIKEAVPAIEFYFQRYLSGAETKNSDINSLKKNLRIIMGKIKNISSAVEKSFWISQLSLKTKIKEEILVDEMNNLKVKNSDVKTAFANAGFGEAKDRARIFKPVSRLELIGHKLIGLIALKEELRKEWKSEIEKHFNYLPTDCAAIIGDLIKEKKIEDEYLAELFNSISLKLSLEWHQIDEEKTRLEIFELLKNLRHEYRHQQKQEIASILKQAEIDGDEKQIISALKKIDEIAKES